MTDPTHEEMLEEAARRESENKALEALDKLYDENGQGMKELAKIEIEEYTDEQIKQWVEND